MKLSAMIVLTILAVFSLLGCQSSDTANRLSPLDTAYQNVMAWPKLQQPQYQFLQENIEDARKAASPADDQLLVKDSVSGDDIFVAQIGWSVIICHLSPDLAVQEVFVEPAKLGFTICDYGGWVVILNQHPGTGLFYKVPLRVRIENGKMTGKELSGPKRKALFEFLTKEME